MPVPQGGPPHSGREWGVREVAVHCPHFGRPVNGWGAHAAEMLARLPRLAVQQQQQRPRMRFEQPRMLRVQHCNEGSLRLLVVGPQVS